LFSVIGFLVKVSLALSTDIIFPYRYLQPRDASDKVRDTHLALCIYGGQIVRQDVPRIIR
jgi:hypothetical protein